MKLIYYLGVDTFQLYSSFACCMTFIFIKNHEKKDFLVRVLGVYRWLHSMPVSPRDNGVVALGYNPQVLKLTNSDNILCKKSKKMRCV